MYLSRDGFAPKARTLWCGPSLIARVLECSYENAEREYRLVSPRHYGTWGPVVQTFWHHTVDILRKHNKVAGQIAGDERSLYGILPFNQGYKRNTFRAVMEWLSGGTYAARTSGHVQVVRKVGGRIYIHDNQRDQEWYPGMKGYSKIHCDAILRLNV